MEIILKAENINFSYGHTQILSDINMNFEKGKVHAIIGKSGSGKTTLLSILSGITKFQDGKIMYKNQDLKKLSLQKYYKETSIIFQDFNLISYLTAFQNVLVGLDIVKYQGDKKEKAKEVLKLVDIDEKDWYRPCNKLSGGQQQRVAIARALAIDSEIIFADEPTGNLDNRTRNDIIDLLCEMAYKYRKCVICVTHDNKFRNKSDIVFAINDGKIRS